jgi:hypothetical protein
MPSHSFAFNSVPSVASVVDKFRLPIAEDNRATGWIELVVGSENRQGQPAPVHPFDTHHGLLVGGNGCPKF